MIVEGAVINYTGAPLKDAHDLFELTATDIANKYVKWKPQTTKHASIIKQYDLIWEMVKTLAMCRSVYC